MIRLTAKAALTNFNGTYIMTVFLAVFTLIAMVAPPDAGAVPGGVANLLMSIGLVTALQFGLLAGSTLAEIKVKPMSFLLPAQERSMAPAVLLIGVVVCLVHALLLLARPMTVVELPALQQSFASFGFGLGLFMLMVAVCVATRDTAYTSLVPAVPFLLLAASFGNEALSQSLIAATGALAERPVAALVFAALGASALFRLLGSRRVSRDCCGAPFLPLKAYDNPFKMDHYRNRIRSGAFRPGLLTDPRGAPGGALLAALSRRMAGTSWDYLALDSRISSNRWEITFRLVYLVLFIALLVFAMLPNDVYNGLALLVLFVILTFMFFAPVFRPRLCPMLPVSRRQHFRAFLAKAVVVYLLTLLGLTLLRLGAQLVSRSIEAAVTAPLAAIAALPFRGIIVVTLVIPLLCWGFTKIRSSIGFLVLMIVSFVVLLNVAAFAEERLLGLDYRALFVVSLIAWLPFILIAAKRCFRDDLLLP